MSRMTYGDYLGLDRLLTAAEPRSGAHDEMLFLVIHQASELWMKLTLHELEAARAALIADTLDPAFKMMARVSRIQHQLIQSWEVLSTMTPSDYSAVRPHLGTSSGFQSAQYRLIEYMLGNKNPKMTAIHEDGSENHARLKAAERQPSLYDEALRLLARRGLSIPADHLERDFTAPYEASAEVEAVWMAVYCDPARHWDLYELAEKLVDLQYHFQLWRFGHLKTVERVIGFKSGTGGTPGVPYLEGVVAKSFFPELLSVRTAL
ncbi:MAG: tryptophan 2,3-dioxygenase family protein [Pseudomonadota bacterium]